MHALSALRWIEKSVNWMKTQPWYNPNYTGVPRPPPCPPPWYDPNYMEEPQPPVPPPQVVTAPQVVPSGPPPQVVPPGPPPQVVPPEPPAQVALQTQAAQVLHAMQQGLQMLQATLVASSAIALIRITT